MPFVLFDSDVALAATIHRGVDDLVTPQPAVLVTGSWLTVKEQMPDRYAAQLARRGYTAVTIDFAGFGASGGGLRQAEIPARKVADITAAARAIASLSFVRAGAVAHLGICASAQYALRAIAEGAPIAAFAAVAGWFHDATTVSPLYGGAGGVGVRLEAGARATETYLATGEVVTVPAYDPADERAAMAFELPYYAETTRGAVPTWRNEMAELSWTHWLTYDGLSPADAVSVPSLLVHGDGCVLPDNARDVARRIGPSAHVVWAEGTQTDFYDQDVQVDLAVDAVDEHLRAALGA